MLSNYVKSFMGCLIVFISLVCGSNIGAQEWSTPIRISEIAEGWYPQLMAEGDTVHAVYVNSIYDQIRYNSSVDGGENWNVPRVLSDTLVYSIGFTQILKYGTKLTALWRAELPGTSPISSNIGYNISTDNGQTWSVPAYVFSSNWRAMAKIYISNTGPIINITITSNGNGLDIFIYNVRSTDFGETWSEPDLIFQPALISGIGDQVSSGNYVHLVWTGSVIDYLPPVKPNYTKSTDAGLTWSDNVELGVCGTGSQYAAISANDKGNVAVLWIGQSHNVNLRVSHDFGDTWEPAVEITSNNTARRTCDIRLTGNSILTCWQDYRYDPDLGAIYFKKSLDGGQSWEDEYYVDRNSDHSWNPSLTGTVDRHYMIWYDGRSVGGPGIYFSRWPDEITSVDNEDRILPEKISLYAYPNPFNSSTTITYNGLAPGYIGIYDIRGRLVKRLQLSDRTKSITWDASSDDGSWITSGVYFIRAIDSEHDYKACIKLLYIK